MVVKQESRNLEAEKGRPASVTAFYWVHFMRGLQRQSQARNAPCCLLQVRTAMQSTLLSASEKACLPMPASLSLAEPVRPSHGSPNSTRPPPAPSAQLHPALSHGLALPALFWKGAIRPQTIRKAFCFLQRFLIFRFLGSYMLIFRFLGSSQYSTYDQLPHI